MSSETIIISALETHGRLTYLDLIQESGLTYRTLAKNLKKLKSKGLVKCSYSLQDARLRYYDLLRQEGGANQ